MEIDRYIYIYTGHFSDIILTLVSQTARGQVSSPELSTLLLPWQSPRCSCSHACSMQAIKWQRFEAPLKKSSCEGNGFCRADNQAVPQPVPHPYSWLCKVNGDTKRIERKKKKLRHIQKKHSKKLLTTLPGNPCSQLNAVPEGKAGQGMDRHACRSTAPGPNLGQEAELSRNGLITHQAWLVQGL